MPDEKDFRDLDRRVTRLESDVDNMQQDNKKLVTRDEFSPVKMITYSLAGSSLFALLGAVLSKIIIK